MRSFGRPLAAAIAFILLSLPAPSTASPGIAGHWEGTWGITEKGNCPNAWKGTWFADFWPVPGGLEFQFYDTLTGTDKATVRGSGESISLERTTTRGGLQMKWKGTLGSGAATGTLTLGGGGCGEQRGEWRGKQTRADPEPTPTGVSTDAEPTPTGVSTDAEPTPTTQPGARRIAGPSHSKLEGGGELDVRPGGRAVINPPMNIDLEFGFAHLRERLARFKCPAGYQPAPGPTLSTWIGARCRSFTTPHAGAFLIGTEFTVEVSADATQFRVLEGALEVSDLARTKIVHVGANQTTTVPAGGIPSDPSPFDPTQVQRWWERPDPAALILGALFLALLTGLYFLPTVLALLLRKRRWWVVALIDVLAGWTIIGWIVALVLAFTFPRQGLPTGYPVIRSPDGRWWWDGRAWQPFPGIELSGDIGAPATSPPAAAAP